MLVYSFRGFKYEKKKIRTEIAILHRNPCRGELVVFNQMIPVLRRMPNACVKGHLEPTHLKSSPLFTFSTKS